jgi:ribosomal protein S5
VELCGIKALTGKLLSRTNNKLNISKATIKALKKFKTKTEMVKTEAKEKKDGVEKE